MNRWAIFKTSLTGLNTVRQNKSSPFKVNFTRSRF